MDSNQSGAVGGIILGVFQGSLTHLGASRRLRGQKYIKARPILGHILTFFDPPCQPGQIFLVQNSLYRCPTYGTTCFMLNSHHNCLLLSYLLYFYHLLFNTCYNKTVCVPESSCLFPSDIFNLLLLYFTFRLQPPQKLKSTNFLPFHCYVKKIILCNPCNSNH